MLSVVWLDWALKGLHATTGFIAEPNPIATQQLVDRLTEDGASSGVLPVRYRRGRMTGTHGLESHPNCILVYLHTVSYIEILNLIHACQQYPF